MKHIAGILAVCFALAIAGCGGGGGGATGTGTITKTLTAGSVAVTSAENASKHIYIDDSASTTVRIWIMKGILTADTTISVSTPGGLPAAPANVTLGAAREITLNPVLVATMTVTLPAPAGTVEDQSVDLYRVVGAAWTATASGTVNTDGSASAITSIFGQLAFGD
ncbi:MAG: hypothetical protein ABIH66_14755 [bacterium]